MKDDKSKDGQAEKERKEVQRELRTVKAELKRKEEALTDLQEEMEGKSESWKEREKGLKSKLKEAMEASARAAELEVSSFMSFADKLACAPVSS